MNLKTSFFTGSDVTKIARSLLGMYLFTRYDGKTTGGMIVETEAYSWKERGCHAYNGKQTARNAVMFEEGGRAYVYLCYGVHNLFNIVTNRKGIADAVLIRAIEPKFGIEEMQKRRKIESLQQLTSGPGKLTNALGINRTFNGKLLGNDEVWIEKSKKMLSVNQIEMSARIGIEYAGNDAKLLWRFSVKDNKWVSKSK